MAKKIIDGVHYAIGAVVFRKDRNKVKVLMMKREGGEDSGWEPIKGAIHLGETDEQALMREINEEAGIGVKIIKKLPIPYRGEIPDQGGRVKVHASIYVCEYISGIVRIGEPEHRSYKWMNLEKAVSSIWVKGGSKFINRAYEIFVAER